MNDYRRNMEGIVRGEAGMGYSQSHGEVETKSSLGATAKDALL